MEKRRKLRVLIGKPYLDLHDWGLTLITKTLRDAGYEVIYLGQYSTVEQIVSTAAQEDVDVIGLSFMVGAYKYYLEKMLPMLKDKKLEHAKLVVGGKIFREDIPRLKEMGVDAVFPSETPLEKIVDYFRQLSESIQQPA